MNVGRRAVRTVDEPDGFAIRLTGDSRPGPVDPDADPESAPLPASVSHLLEANDALIPGRWGCHVALCGAQIRGPNTTAVQHECADASCGCVRYCPECVREAGRWSAQAGQAHGADGSWSVHVR